MKRIWYGFRVCLLLHLLWLLAAAVLQTRALPGPLAVYAALGALLRDGLLRHLSASLLRVLGGIALSFLLGVPLGMWMALSSQADRALRPLLYFGYPVPKTALLPVAMLLLGLGESSKLVILTLTTVFQVVVAARDAVLSMDRAWMQVAASAGLPRRALLRHILLPAILPGLFTALRVGLGTSLAILLIIEAYGTRSGLGYLILDAWSRMNYPQMYGGIAALALLGAALFALLDRLDRSLCAWNRPAGSALP